MKNIVQPLLKNLGRSILHRVALFGILGFVVAGTAAGHLNADFTDPAGDEKGTIDVIAMQFRIKDNLGNYRIELTATAQRPFFGQFRVNINLYNPDVTNSALSGFQHVCTKCDVFNPISNAQVDFDLKTPQTKLIISNIVSNLPPQPSLIAWKAGHRVAISTFAGLGNPPGSSFFRSVVGNFPPGFLVNEDTIGYDNNSGDGVTNGVAILH